jgi:esterase
VPARLHHEAVAGRGAARWMLLAHGILGSGANWRGLARKVVERRPAWGIVLVDLRGHGQSEPGEPPHDLAACSGDLRAVVDELGRVDAIAGHSFGAKVALATRALAPPGLAQTWVFDASPGARPAAAPTSDAERLIARMAALPRTFPRREDFVEAIVAAGHPRPLAQWLAMNVVPDAAGTYTLRLDLAAIGEMLADYHARDLWPVVLDPALPGTVEVVVATRSAVITAGDRRRLETAPPHVHTHEIDAGHWLHVEAPDAVADLIARRLP